MRNFLIFAIVPGLLLSYIIVRVVLLRYAVWPHTVTSKSGRVSTTALAMFVCFDEIQAFGRIDELYLARFYLLLWALLAACALGVLSSRFSFIVPLVFYNSYIDEGLWEYRFVVMSVMVMSVPLLAGMRNTLRPSCLRPNHSGGWASLWPSRRPRCSVLAIGARNSPSTVSGGAPRPHSCGRSSGSLPMASSRQRSPR